MVRVLGPVEVTDSHGELRTGGLLQRATLAMLVAAGGQPVRAEVIVEALYGDEGRSKLRVVHTYVSNLRRMLGQAIVAVPAGYRFDSAILPVDADRFTSLLAAARNLRGEDPDRSVRLIESGLDLWRGDPFSGLEDIEHLRPQSVRLEELWLQAVALLSEIRLQLGRHDDVVPDLAAAVARDPYRENLVALLIRALHRGGAVGEARRVYASTVRLLDSEFGAPPGPELRRVAADCLAVDVSAP